MVMGACDVTQKAYEVAALFNFTQDKAIITNCVK